jgi:hypothetical protein
MLPDGWATVHSRFNCMVIDILAHEVRFQESQQPPCGNNLRRCKPWPWASECSWCMAALACRGRPPQLLPVRVHMPYQAKALSFSYLFSTDYQHDGVGRGASILQHYMTQARRR